ncbi:MAG: YjdF family protein [Candidatus Ornithomonoglobus sp.]
MIFVRSSLTILFENPFWVGIYEREYDNQYEVCRIVFGAEPKDYEVYEYMLKSWHRLKFSSPIKSDSVHKNHTNPKRIRRMINKQIQSKGMGTKAQQALKRQYEISKQLSKSAAKERHDAEKNYKNELKQKKKHEKHKGH